MYAEFFGFRELPFNNTPDPRFFYSTPDHEEALASLVYAVQARKGFVLLTGEVGTGKTLVTRMMLRHFGTQLSFANINHAVQSPEELLESICTEFELPFRSGASATQLVKRLHDYLLAQFAQNIPVVLVLDEAQNLPENGFEQLRMIGNLEADDAKLLQIAIVGQPELQRMFLAPTLRQLRQRIFRSYHLPALDRDVTEAYIRHRLTIAGAEDIDLFDGDSINVVFRTSRGLPRLINTICDNALLSAYSADRHNIDEPFVESVVKQMLIIGEPVQERQAVLQAVPVPAARPSRSHVVQGTMQGGPQRRLQTAHPQRTAPVVQPAASAPTNPAAPAVDPSVIAEIHAIRSEVRARAADLETRFAHIEHQLDASTETLQRAGAAAATLKSLLERADHAERRAAATSTELAQREERLGNLAVAVKRLVEALRGALDRTKSTTAEVAKAQRGAQVVHDRIAAQSERSQRATRDLLSLVNRVASSRAVARATVPTDAPAFDVPTKQPAEAADASTRPAKRDEAARQQRTGVRDMMHGARESLGDLRTLASKGVSKPAVPRTAAAATSSARLARAVEDLLGVVKPDPPSNAVTAPTAPAK